MRIKPEKKKSQRLGRNLALPILSTGVVATVCAKSQPAQLPVVLLLGGAWTAITRNRVLDSEFGYRMNAEIKHLSQQLQVTGLDAGNEMASEIELIKRSIKQNSREVKDIAGTVVRNLNLTREIARKLEVDITSSFPKGKREEASRAAQQGMPPSKMLTTTASKLKEGSGTEEFPDSRAIERPVTHPEIKVAIVADEFTIESFRYEWHLKLLSKENWREEVESFAPDFLFVESAWEGNSGNWRYQLVGNSAPRDEIVQLVSFCRSNGIPTAFWNKEDPPHFEDFLKTASLFDYIFTTEEALIGEYERRTGHSNVALLPFAAQPALHNPVAIPGVARDRSVVFGGMYFRDKYPERRGQMDRLLQAASRVGLDIYSRNPGDDIRYRYPDTLSSFVKGSLRYTQMISAYHAYKVAVNVNSVVGSQSMCARRIFEATACGAAVVTEPTPAIERYFPGDLLSQVANQESAYHTIRSLVRSDEFRDRKVLAAQREVWRNHTYTQRARTIMDLIGIVYGSSETTISYFVSTNRPDNLRLIFENVARQSVKNSELLIATHGFVVEESKIVGLTEEFGLESVRVFPIDSEKSLGHCLNTLVQESNGEVLLRMDDDDFYGRWYAEDMVHALEFSQADLLGKSATYIYFEDMDATVLTFPGKEDRFTDFVRGATFGGPRETFVNYPFPESTRSEDSSVLERLRRDGKKIYATNRFNYAVIRNGDKEKHTWQVDDISLFGTGEMKFRGFDPNQIEA